jgi:DNA-binding SARP family transcriptional activator
MRTGESRTDMRTEIKVLGPLEAHIGGQSIVPSAGKPSQVLAMLALNAGHVVTVSALCEEIWDYQPPRSSVPTLHTYILKLRKKLDDALAADGTGCAKDILVTRRAGYQLNVAPDDVDTVCYDRLSSAGRHAVNQGDHETAAHLLGTALRLWRGPALADVPTGPQLAIESMRLEENRLGDLHLRIEADLKLGRHHQLLAELATLCARHPMLENFCVQHMIALSRSGRQSEALAAYRRLRTGMVEQLGVEPSHRVRHVHRAILTGQPLTNDVNLAGRR